MEMVFQAHSNYMLLAYNALAIHAFGPGIWFTLFHSDNTDIAEINEESEFPRNASWQNDDG